MGETYEIDWRMDDKWFQLIKQVDGYGSENQDQVEGKYNPIRTPLTNEEQKTDVKKTIPNK